MALQKDYIITQNYIAQNNHIGTFDDIITQSKTVTKAYIKIESLSGDKTKMYLTVNIYDNSDCKNIKHSKVYGFTPYINENSPNFIKQGYEYLKTLDEFKDAVDC